MRIRYQDKTGKRANDITDIAYCDKEMLDKSGYQHSQIFDEKGFRQFVYLGYFQSALYQRSSYQPQFFYDNVRCYSHPPLSFNPDTAFFIIRHNNYQTKSGGGQWHIFEKMQSFLRGKGIPSYIILHRDSSCDLLISEQKHIKSVINDFGEKLFTPSVYQEILKKLQKLYPDNFAKREEKNEKCTIHRPRPVGANILQHLEAKIPQVEQTMRHLFHKQVNDGPDIIKDSSNIRPYQSPKDTKPQISALDHSYTTVKF